MRQANSGGWDFVGLGLTAFLTTEYSRSLRGSCMGVSTMRTIVHLGLY